MGTSPHSLALYWFIGCLVATTGFADDPVAKKARRLQRSNSDNQRIALLKLFLKDLENPRNVFSDNGLKVKAALIPDALSHRICQGYLKARENQLSHEDAVAKLAVDYEKAKRIEGRPLVKLILENPGYTRGKHDRRLFTVRDKIPGKVLTLRQRGRTIPLTLAGKPSGLSSTEVRVKKYWVSARRGDVRESDAPPGRKAKLSKPMPIFLLERGPAELRLLVKKPKALKSLSKLELRLTGVKRYDGPFKKNRIDLNDRRTWNPIRAITIDLDLPPGGKEIPKPLAALVSDVHRAASEAGPETVRD